MALVRIQIPLSDLSGTSEELRQVFFSKFIENLQEV
jgi:hypothetical protein